jgi:anaphase-promoting complex subunit 5
MHAHFGHVDEATQALNEAVRIAQQYNDDACLAHALAALCHMLFDVGAGNETYAKGENLLAFEMLGLGLLIPAL